MTAPAWRNRIVDHAEVDPADLQANERNWRRHPKAQRTALRQALEAVGVVDEVLVNRTTGRLVDGHLRVELALEDGEPTIPVSYVELTPEEEALVLATFDPLSAMAETNVDALTALTAGLPEELAAIVAAVSGSLPPASDVVRLRLAERFLFPPFSVLITRGGDWQDRRRDWLALGIQSEGGRGDDLVYDIEGLRDADKYGPVGMIGTSVFDPVLTELLYRWFSPPGGVVLDPFAGGSVRGIVAGMLGRAYTGFELRAEQVAANVAQCVTIRPAVAPVWVQADSSLAAAAGFPELEEPADFILTCPPYYDLEVYGHDPGELSALGTYYEFREQLAAIIRGAVDRLRPDRFAAIVVTDIRDKAGMYRPFVSDTIAAFEAAGAGFYNRAILVNNLGTLPIRTTRTFNAARKLGRTHQDVLVFCKGDPKAATRACGAVEVGDVEEGRHAR